MGWSPPPPPVKTTTIFVNARPKYLTERMLTRDEVLRLAGYDWRSTSVLVDELAVTHRASIEHDRQRLESTQALQLTEGMIIDVYCPPDERSLHQ